MNKAPGACLPMLLGCLLSMGALPVAGQSPSLLGIVEPLNDALLSASIGGTLEAILQDEGSEVSEGDELLQLNKTLEQYEVDRRRLIWENRAEVDAAEARMKTLERDVKATRSLFEKTASVSREEVEHQELEHQLSVAAHRQLVSMEDQQRIEFLMAEEHLAQCAVVAPFSGTVTEVYLDPGEACEPRQPLVRLVDVSRCYLTMNLTAPVAETLRIHQQVSLSFAEPGGAIERPGEVTFISPVADAASGLVRVKVLFENAGGRVRPGLAGRLLLSDANQ